MADESKKINYSEQKKKLEQITEFFEKGDFQLEQALDKFKQGLEIAKKLEKRLKEVENEVKEIKIDFEKEK